MNDEIFDIVAQIEVILQNEKNEPANMLGSYIVGATILRTDYEYYQQEYPLLDEIAEIAADLETLGGTPDEEIALKEILKKFEEFKLSLE